MVWGLLLPVEKTLVFRKEKRMKQPHKKRRGRPSKEKLVPPQTAKEFYAMPEDLQELWVNVTHVVSDVRNRFSLTRASRNWGIDPETAIELAGSTLRKGANGLYEAEPTDRLLRILLFPTYRGLDEIAVLDSDEASRIGEYWNAVHRYLETGDVSVKKFEGINITDADGTKVPLLTELEELDRLGSAGVLSFESVYARSA
jgi:hypothetical protein